MPVDPDRGEPRGDGWDEPREDGLTWDAQGGTEWINSDGVMTCGSKRRAINVGRTEPDPLRCASTAKMPNGRCGRHGGNNAKGMAVAAYDTGKFSKYFPKRIYDGFLRVEKDPVLRTLELESFLLFNRVTELVGDLPQRTSAVLWKDCGVCVGKISKALKKGNTEVVYEVMNELIALVETGASGSESWGQILDVIDARRKVAAVEDRRRGREENTITHEQAMMLVHGVIHACNEILHKYNVPDAARNEIADALIRLTSAGNRDGATA